MNKVFLGLSFLTLGIHAMKTEDTKKDVLLKYCLMRFIDKNDTAAVVHLVNHGAAYIIDKEVSETAKKNYQQNEVNNQKTSPYSPAESIYCLIESVFNPQKS